MSPHPFTRPCVAGLLAVSLLLFMFGLFATEWVGHYGFTLFQVLPAAGGFLAVLIASRPARVTFGWGVGLSLIPVAIGGLLFLATGFEGFICLVMAAPIMVFFAALGAVIALIATGVIPWVENCFHVRGCGGGGGPKANTTALVILPLAIALTVEPRFLPHPPTREVRSSVVVRGDIAKVWETVVAFPEITSAPGGIFDYGIAYPIRATIEGTGVGAIRRCTFNTGDFVEPITAWEAPHRLAFDVVENPLPMKEWSFWGDIDTPHLHGFMVSERGQFELTAQADGTVLLEGTTWYHQNLWPNAYWGAVSDEIIHKIHGRVLGHIRDVVEGRSGLS
ncbi:MAG: hypothetical protein JNK74_23415 [Candidatus Hydrogenedentes bacterium]|nr:hypothetical protein [Candidatus Hydrogenedentota bacterium]